MSDANTSNPHGLTGRAAASAFSGRAGYGGGRPVLGLADFSPRLLSAYLFSQGMTMPAGRRLEDRPVVDYEMEFILESSGSQLIGGTVHPIRRGDVVLRCPGQRTQGIMPYSCLTIIFDLEGRYRPRPIPYFSVWNQPHAEQVACPHFKSDFIDIIPPVSHPESGDLYRSLFETCLKHYISPGEGSELIQKASILQILYHLHGQARDPIPAGPVTQHQKLQTVLAYMRRNYRRKLPLKELGEVAALSPTYLHRVFSATMGESPLDHLNRLRMDAARELLATSDLSACSVAQEVGFDNVSYFFTLFRRQTGLTPAAFRERHRFAP
jgi:AraC-like DNA-binding protein